MGSSTILTVQYATGQIGELIFCNFSPIAENCCNCAGYDAVHGFSDKLKLSSPRELLSWQPLIRPVPKIRRAFVILNDSFCEHDSKHNIDISYRFLPWMRRVLLIGQYIDAPLLQTMLINAMTRNSVFPVPQSLGEKPISLFRYP